MLSLYRSSRATPTSAIPSGDLPSDLVWIDVFNGTDDEIAAVERATGLNLPSCDSLREVEHSSRMRREGEALVVSLPLPAVGENGATLIPVGFVLAPDRLVTIRFDAQEVFAAFVDGFGQGRPADAGAVSIMIGLMEALVDHLADKLEDVGEALDQLAGRIFGAQMAANAEARAPKVKDAALRGTMRRVGRIGQGLGKARASLLTAGRVVPFIENKGADWLDEGTTARLHTLRADIESLDEYESHLTDKVQFLLDAALGLINIEQNNTFKVLTIASVVGIPPTLIASMYGMNFHNMPELNWAWGYPYGLALIALSAIVPIVWFKAKGWF